MFKAHSHQQSDSMLKYSSISNLKGNDEADFNINKFRDNIYSKIKSFNNENDRENTGFYVKSSVPQKHSRQSEMKSRQNKINIKSSIPSFDDILKTMTSNKLKEKEASFQISAHHKKNPTDTSRKLSGIQTKIEAFGAGGIDQSQTQVRLSQRNASQQRIPPETPKVRTNYQFQHDKSIIAKSAKNTLIDKLPLKELMEIRSKIEGSNCNEIQGLSINYVAELVKLAQVITRQVKKAKY